MGALGCLCGDFIAVLIIAASFYRIVFCNYMFAGGRVTQQLPRPDFYDICTSGSIISVFVVCCEVVDEFCLFTLYFL